MKTLLAIDGSAHSKATVEEFASGPFPANTEVHIVPDYERAPRTMNIDPIGVSKEYYAEADHFILKTAEDTTKNAARVLSKKNPSLTVTTIALEGSPKSVILKEDERFGADLIVVGSHGFRAVNCFMLG